MIALHLKNISGINNVKITSVHPHIITTGMFNNVKAKWPRIFPLLEPEWVAEEIVKATREEKEQVYYHAHLVDKIEKELKKLGSHMALQNVRNFEIVLKFLSYLIIP